MVHRVYIRPLEERDALTSFRWRNDPEIWKFTGKRPDRTITQEVEIEWIRRIIRDPYSHRFAICLSDDNAYIGNIQLTNLKNNEAEYHIFIGLKEYWGKGLAAEASLLLIEWAKRNLSLKQIYLIVNPDHKTAIDLYTKLGFLAVSDDIKMILEL